jgi:alkylhydroperoxidase/carboxymuconolactone decarboxylase family protein YurZ
MEFIQTDALLRNALDMMTKHLILIANRFPTGNVK